MRVFCFLQVTILFNISVICTTAAPALSDDSTVVTASHYLIADGKEDQPATTVNSKDLLKGPPNCDLSTGSKSSSIEVALFYVNQTNFVFIAINVFDAKYFSSYISDAKLHENYQMAEDYADLVKAVKINNQIVLNLNGISPNDKSSERLHKLIL